MQRGTWLEQLQRNFISSQQRANAEQASPLWLEMHQVAQRCCAGSAPPQQWMDLYFQQYWHLRTAYKSLRSLERELPDKHPALGSSRRLRQLLLAARGNLQRARELLPDRGWDAIEHELSLLRTGLAKLEIKGDELQQALQSLHCLGCGAWVAPAESACPVCAGPLQPDSADETWEPQEGAERMPTEYARLRELADAVRSSPEQGDALRQHALHLVQQLRDTEGPTRDLRLEDPEAPVEEMLQELRASREALLELAQWALHRSMRRLERGWQNLIQHLGRYEELLEEFEEKANP